MSGSRANNESRKVVRHVCLFAAVAMIAQFALTIGRYASDVDHMSDHLLDMEIAAVADGLTAENGKPVFTLPRSLRARYGGETGYAARIRTRAGVVLFESCDAVCMAARLPQETPDTLSWLRRNRDGYPISVTGGRTFEIAGQPVLIDISIEHDPAGRVWSVFGEELVEEMLVPTAITLGFALLASLFAIRRSLALVKAAAAKAEALDPARPYVRVETDGMPLEIAQFAGAMDRGYRKVRELMEAQKVFTAAISHEVRTPLAIVRLELEAIDHARASGAIKEIDDLVAFVEQLTALSRIEGAERPALVPTDLDGVLRDAVERRRTDAAGPPDGAHFFVNHDFVGYEVPVHADIARHGVLFLDETDPNVSPMTAKGSGRARDLRRRPSRTPSTTPRA